MAAVNLADLEKMFGWEFGPPELGPTRNSLRDHVGELMRQYDALDYSTRVCKCGDSVTWGNNYDDLKRFMDKHIGCYVEQ